MSVMVVQITGDSTFVQKFVLVIVKENIKVLCRWNLLGESTGDRQIPPHKGLRNSESVYMWWRNRDQSEIKTRVT